MFYQCTILVTVTDEAQTWALKTNDSKWLLRTISKWLLRTIIKIKDLWIWRIFHKKAYRNDVSVEWHKEMLKDTKIWIPSRWEK